MDLIQTLRSTGAVREFEDRAVSHEVIARVLDTARFAPNGGNQQAWRVIVVEDSTIREGIRDLYVPGWVEYLEMRASGVQPWAPIGDRDAESEAIARAADRDTSEQAIGEFAAQFDSVPAMLVVLADLRLLAAVDRDLDRYSIVGGASIYPFVWSILLAAHAEGLGGVITTMAVAREPELQNLLGVPEEFCVAAVLALGYPTRRSTRLSRSPVESFATIDTFSGNLLPVPK
ncbi:MAG: nitroreductase family protein [Microthrixaceae bacterium]